MELRHLRYFVTLAECLHFGQAAAKLRIAQPSLTLQIQQLEAELQSTLLRRANRRVELTDAGRIFLEQARDILARADRAGLVTRRASAGEATRLRVAVGYCMDHLDASRTVGIFNRAHDAVHVELHTMSAGAQISALNDGRIDIGFVRPPIADATLTSEVLLREPFLVALPSSHRLAAKQPVALAALAHEEFVLPPRDAVPIYHDLVLRTCREAGFIPHAPHEGDHVLLMLGMVAAGAGVALVPSSARKIKQRGVVLAELRPSHPVLETLATWRRDNASPFVAEFVKVARQVMARNGRSRTVRPGRSSS